MTKLHYESNFPMNDIELVKQQDPASLIAFEELTKYLLTSKKEGYSKEVLIKCLVGLQELNLEVPEKQKEPVEKQLIAEFKQDQNKFTFEDVQQLIEIVADVGLSSVAQTALQEVTKDDFVKLRYGVKISGEVFEHSEHLANIHVTDRWANTQMDLAIWPDDDTLNHEFIDEMELGGTYIMVYDTDSGELEPESIRDFFGETVGREVEKSIVEAYLNGTDLQLRVTNDDFLEHYLPQRFVLNQIGEIADKAESQSIMKKDVLSLARTLQHTNVEIDDIEFLKEPITQALKKANVRPKEISLIKESFSTLNFEPSVFKAFKKNHELVRG